VLDFRFPVRRNARVSVGLTERKLRFKKVGLTQPLLHAIIGGHRLLRPQARYQRANANERNVHPCGACSSIGSLQQCILHGTGRVLSLDSSTSTSSSRVPFTPATVNSPSNPAMLSLALSGSSSTPTPSGSTSDSATSNPSSHYDSFHANPPTPYTHTGDVCTRAAGDE